MCRQHLLGEHNEIHMCVGCILKDKSIKGFIDNGLIEVHSLEKRHFDLAREIIKRGYKHDSDLPYFLPMQIGEINLKKNIEELKKRCPECRALIEKQRM